MGTTGSHIEELLSIFIPYRFGASEFIKNRQNVGYLHIYKVTFPLRLPRGGSITILAGKYNGMFQQRIIFEKSSLSNFISKLQIRSNKNRQGHS